MANIYSEAIENFESPLGPEDIAERLDAMVGQAMEIIKSSLQKKDEESAGVYWRALHQLALLGRAFALADPKLAAAPPEKPDEPPVWQPLMQKRTGAYAAVHNGQALASTAALFTPENHDLLHRLEAETSFAAMGLAPEELPGTVAAGIVSILEPSDIPPELRLGFASAQS